MTALTDLSEAPPVDWQARGLCAAMDAEVFFPPSHVEHKVARETREARAKAICARCPVRAPCLEWALQTREPHGIWGGCTEHERKQARNGRREAS